VIETEREFNHILTAQGHVGSESMLILKVDSGWRSGCDKTSLTIKLSEVSKADNTKSMIKEIDSLIDCLKGLKKGIENR
jgi:hypothetical protein